MFSHGIWLIVLCEKGRGKRFDSNVSNDGLRNDPDRFDVDLKLKVIMLKLCTITSRN